MFTPRWRKVMRDLWLNKTRTALVVFSIAVGTFAVGVIINSQLVLESSLAETYAATKPAHANILTLTPFDEQLAKSVRNIEGVEEAEARRNIVVRLETGPDEWVNLQLLAIPDYNNIRVSKVSPDGGAWPPQDHDILIERSALGLTKAAIGDMVTIKTPSGKERQVRVAGQSHDLQASIYVLSGIAYGHIHVDMLEWLGEPSNFNELHVRVAGDVHDSTHLKSVIDEVQDKVEKSGQTVLFTLVQPPGQLPVDYVIQAMLAILGAVGLLSLLLSGFLVVNTISAVLLQQTRQIGVMKAIGARSSQLVPMYLVMVLLYGVLALLVALPLGMISAFYFTKMMGGMLNFDLNEFRVSPAALGLQVVVAILVPLIAGIFPILSGTRVTVHQAITSQGIGGAQFGSSIIDRWLTSRASQRLLGFLSRPRIISLRNTFRRKTRLMLTLVTLIIGGAIFIAVMSLQASLRSTLDSWLDYYQYDVAVQFVRPYRIERAKNSVMQVPGVVHAEGWSFYTTRRLRPDGTNSGNIIVFGPPADTQVIRPSIVEGRWLLPEDENAIVLSTIALRDEDDIEVGDDIIIKIAGKERSWRVVGIAQGGTPAASAFVSYDVLSRMLGKVGRAEYLMIATEQHSAEYQTKMTSLIENQLTKQGFRVNLAAPASQDKQTIETIFQLIFALLLVVAFVLALVGGLGLMGTMSINVLERTREIGVMRAVGAKTASILSIVIFEGILIGAISWIVGTSFAYPISQAMSDTVGELFLSTTLDYQFSTNGMISWLVLVITLAAIASFLPAIRAARLTVREILAYE
ncbi:MAG: FtsX-like permease family protein [Ardenticatenaceae bacterium]